MRRRKLMTLSTRLRLQDFTVTVALADDNYNNFIVINRHTDYRTDLRKFSNDAA